MIPNVYIVNVLAQELEISLQKFIQNYISESTVDCDVTVSVERCNYAHVHVGLQLGETIINLLNISCTGTRSCVLFALLIWTKYIKN